MPVVDGGTPLLSEAVAALRLGRLVVMVSIS